jgi:hypothetical protein
METARKSDLHSTYSSSVLSSFKHILGVHILGVHIYMRPSNETGKCIQKRIPVLLERYQEYHVRFRRVSHDEEAT